MLSKFSKGQYLYIASALKTLSEGIILGSSAAFFLPESLQLGTPISLIRFMVLFLVGMLLLIIGVIIQKRGEK